MGRVNAYMKGGNENREVSVGGRRPADRVWAWLNTDNSEGEAAVKVEARVVGEGVSSAARKAGSDRRVSSFKVDLPDPSEAVKVRIHGKGLWEASEAARRVGEEYDRLVDGLVGMLADLGAACRRAARSVLGDVRADGMGDLADAIAATVSMAWLEKVRERHPRLLRADELRWRETRGIEA